MKSSFVVLISLSLALAGQAPARTGSTPADTPLEATASVEVERLRVEGFTALYSLEYDAAGRVFDKMVEVAPDRPQGYLFRATNTWFRSLFKQRLLSTSLYTRDEFYEQKERTVDPAVDKAFRADVQRAIKLGQARVAANPKDVEALYYLGAAHGSLAGYEASMARAFMSALRHGSKAVDLHEKALALDPSLADAYLTLGMYHYVVGSLPLPVKLLVAVGGVRGSKKNGLAELERVVKEGKRNADDARVILIALYQRERRVDDAIRLLRELQEKYPSNFILRLEEGNLLAELGRYAEATVVFEKLAASPRAMAEARDFVEFAHAEALRKNGEHEKALARFERVIAWKGADADLVTLARLGAGQCLDALGRRQDAEASYRLVLKRGDILDSRKRAEGYLKTPYAPSRPMAPTGQAPTASAHRATSSGLAGCLTT
jgi:tetratricopeptide (TPR) repeat protein